MRYRIDIVVEEKKETVFQLENYRAQLEFF